MCVLAVPLTILFEYCTVIMSVSLHSLAHYTLLLVTGHRPHQGHRGNEIHAPPPPTRSPDKRSGAKLINKERMRYAITGEASPCAILAAPHHSSLSIQQYLHILGGQ